MNASQMNIVAKRSKSALLFQSAADHELIANTMATLDIELMLVESELSLGELVRRHKPDLILMPAALLPDELPTPLPPIILLCDIKVGKKMSEYIAKGVDDFIFLPLQVEVLKHRVEQQLLLADAHQVRREWHLNQLKLQELGELVGLVSHEVASPLGNINTAVSFLLESSEVIHRSYKSKELAAADLERFLARMDRALTMSIKNGNNASGIISSFRTVATNQCLERLNHFFLHRYIDDVILTLKSKLKKLPHELHVVIGESVEMISYSGVIAQVIVALINKSIVHGFDDKVEGKIIISAMVKADDNGVERVLLNYMDDGCGMPEQAYKQLFQDSDELTFEYNETLSMSMIKYLVEHKLQGTFTVTSVVGEGVSCTLDLPQKLLL